MLQKQFKTALACIAVGVLGRLFPHIPNVTPMLGLSLYSGTNFPRWLAFFILIVTLFITDTALMLMYGYPIFSAWTLFTYSGFLLITFVGEQYSRIFSRINGLAWVVIISFGFWLWTNFGVWLSGSLYPRTISGLSFCYVTALPFLRNALVGDVVWSAVFFGLFAIASKRLKASSGGS
jgi:hypothetical protein